MRVRFKKVVYLLTARGGGFGGRKTCFSIDIFRTILSHSHSAAQTRDEHLCILCVTTPFGSNGRHRKLTNNGQVRTKREKRAKRNKDLIERETMKTKFLLFRSDFLFFFASLRDANSGQLFVFIFSFFTFIHFDL